MAKIEYKGYFEKNKFNIFFISLGITSTDPRDYVPSPQAFLAFIPGLMDIHPRGN